MRKAPVIRSSGRRRPLYPTALLVTGLVAAGAIALPATAASAADGPVVVSDSEFTDGSYVVTLRDPAVTAYDGGKSGFAATATPDEGVDLTDPATSKYVEHLQSEQEAVAGSVGVTPVATYQVTTNGFAADLTAAQAKQLVGSSKVAAVVKNEILHTTAVPSTDYLGLSGAGGVWGTQGTGEGVVVGVIDTGIAPENPSFAGDALTATPSDTVPYTTAAGISYEKSDGGTFTGVCQRGETFDQSDCSTKIVGARYFLGGFGEDRIETAENGEYVSPRDGDSHGSHTASTAAGNADVPVTINGRDFGVISGVAPDAKVAAYKVCWTGKVSAEVADGCATADLLSAIDAATADNVDVINYSIGGGSATSTNSLTDQAFYNAAAAGIFVAASAGNSGPGASTLDNAAPWITTVAASTIPSYDATAQVTGPDGVVTNYLGGSTSLSTDPAGVTGRFVDALSSGLPGVDRTALSYCTGGTLDPALVTGTIVLCDRGVTDRTAKSAEVQRAGGIGMVLVNKTPSSVDVDAHVVPTVHVDAGAGNVNYTALHAAAAPGTSTVTLLDGNPTGQPEPATPQVAGFSSRGPVEADGGNVLKPDVAAPGVAILAAGANAEGAAATYEFLSGTSMSSPHVAGLAALYLSVTPTATPMEVKSAMMTTAGDTVDTTGAPSQDVFAQGAGQVQPADMFDAGLLYLSGVAEWDSYIATLGSAEGSQLNQASIAVGALLNSTTVTRTVTSTGAGTYTAQPVSLPGVATTVSPSTLSFTGAGQTASYEVTFSRTTAAYDQYTTGYLTWTDGGAHTVRSPLAVRPVAVDVPSDITGTGVTGSADAPITSGGDQTLALSAEGLVKGERTSGSGTVGDFDYVDVTIPADTQFVRYQLTAGGADAPAVDEPVDFDLTLYELDATGTPVAITATSATSAADEQIDITKPEAGSYLLEVAYYSGGETMTYDLDAYTLIPSAYTGSFAVSPTTLTLASNQEAVVTASWTGLEPESQYLGRIVYGATGRVTYVTVDSGPAVTAPVDPGTPSPAPGDPGAGAPGTGAPGAGGAGGTGGGNAAPAASDLAFTGQDVAPMIAAGVALLLAGLAAAVIGRRRLRSVAVTERTPEA